MTWSAVRDHTQPAHAVRRVTRDRSRHRGVRPGAVNGDALHHAMLTMGQCLAGCATTCAPTSRPPTRRSSRALAVVLTEPQYVAQHRGPRARLAHEKAALLRQLVIFPHFGEHLGSHAMFRAEVSNEPTTATVQYGVQAGSSPAGRARRA